jgi:hypothetical protein
MDSRESDRHCPHVTSHYKLGIALKNGLPFRSDASRRLAAIFMAAASFCMGATNALAGSHGGGRSQSAQSVTVPLQFDGDFPVVMAKINGQKLLLMIDLGQAAPLVLFQSAMDTVKPIAVDSKYKFPDAAGNLVEVPMFKVQRIDIGGITFTEVEGYVDSRKPSAQTSPSTSQGMIGFMLLRSLKVVLDYRHHKMTLIQSRGSFAENDDCRGTAVPLLPGWHDAPVAKAHTNLGDLVLVWDTGATLSVIRKKTADDANATISNQSVSIQHLSLGSTDFGPMDLRVFDYSEPAGTDGFIGYDFFSNHVVCVDFPGKRLLVQR